MSEFIEALEARELLSASPLRVAHPHHGAHKLSSDPIIAQDQANIVAAQDKVKTDTVACRAQLVADRAAVPAIRKADQAIVVQDRIKIRQDQGNPNAVLADRGQLLIDEAKLKDDVAAAQAKIKSDAADCKAMIADDNASLKAARLKLRNDRIAHL